MNTQVETDGEHDRRPITTRAHGVADYVVGVVLILAPNLLGFAHLDSPAVWVPRLIGALTILQAIVTRYELGLIKLIPMKLHLIDDFVVGAFLAASPWLLRFYDPANQRLWVPHLVVGVGIIIITAMTEKYPRSLDVRHGTRHSDAHA